MSYKTLEELAKVSGVVTGVGIVLTILALCAEAFILAGIIFSLPAIMDMVLFGLTVIYTEEGETE